MFVLLLSCILGAQAQESIVVTGVVTDKNKEPLVGVNITVGDMVGLGTITDINGKYKIKMEPYHRLIFSYIGFEGRSISKRTTGYQCRYARIRS